MSNVTPDPSDETVADRVVKGKNDTKRNMMLKDMTSENNWSN